MAFSDDQVEERRSGGGERWLEVDMNSWNSEGVAQGQFQRREGSSNRSSRKPDLAGCFALLSRENIEISFHSPPRYRYASLYRVRERPHVKLITLEQGDIEGQRSTIKSYPVLLKFIHLDDYHVHEIALLGIFGNER